MQPFASDLVDREGGGGFQSRRRDMPAFRAFEALRPFLWIALVAFVAGFSGYLALSGQRAPAGQDAAGPVWVAADDPGPPRNI